VIGRTRSGCSLREARPRRRCVSESRGRGRGGGRRGGGGRTVQRHGRTARVELVRLLRVHRRRLARRSVRRRDRRRLRPAAAARLSPRPAHVGAAAVVRVEAAAEEVAVRARGNLGQARRAVPCDDGHGGARRRERRVGRVGGGPFGRGDGCGRRAVGAGRLGVIGVGKGRVGRGRRAGEERGRGGGGRRAGRRARGVARARRHVRARRRRRVRRLGELAEVAVGRRRVVAVDGGGCGGRRGRRVGRVLVRLRAAVRALRRRRRVGGGLLVALRVPVRLGELLLLLLLRRRWRRGLLGEVARAVARLGPGGCVVARAVAARGRGGPREGRLGAAAVALVVGGRGRHAELGVRLRGGLVRVRVLLLGRVLLLVVLLLVRVGGLPLVGWVLLRWVRVGAVGGGGGRGAVGALGWRARLDGGCWAAEQLIVCLLLPRAWPRHGRGACVERGERRRRSRASTAGERSLSSRHSSLDAAGTAYRPLRSPP